MARSIAHLIRRGTVALVIDHHTVHHAPNTVSIHVLEKDTNGKTIHGQDVDGVTVEDLGSTGDISAAINGPALASFVTSLSGGIPTSIDVKPLEPVEEETIGAADVGTIEIK